MNVGMNARRPPPLEWGPCPGAGKPSVKSQEWGGSAMCPICTKYFSVRIGERTPPHVSIITHSGDQP